MRHSAGWRRAPINVHRPRRCTSRARSAAMPAWSRAWQCPAPRSGRPDRIRTEAHCMNSVLKQRTFEDNSPLPELATSLSGSIEYGRTPRLRVSPVASATWPTLVRSGPLEIAIDGHFVVADRLFLGRTPQECEQVAEWVGADLPGFLQP